MTILLIEDEPRAANQLQRMILNQSGEYHILSVIDSVVDAVEWFSSNPLPDLVFMDIQLADGLSFEIFQYVNVEVPIIFTTAFDQYAIQAFKVNSVDYLLKPIQEIDLTNALAQFHKLNSQAATPQQFIQDMLQQMQRTTRQGILVKKGSGFVQLKVDDLLYIYSEESLTFGITSTNRYLIEETLDSLFSTLDPAEFFRINRGQVIHKTAIVKLEPYFNHRIKLSVHHQRDREFIVSRAKCQEFKEWMNR